VPSIVLHPVAVSLWVPVVEHCGVGWARIQPFYLPCTSLEYGWRVVTRTLLILVTAKNLHKCKRYLSALVLTAVQFCVSCA
jgi:hypothetical protein